MTTTETLTIRKALAEKKLLDNKIKKFSENLELVFIYSSAEPYHNGLPIDEAKLKVESNFQSINDLITRREAINKAILDANAVNKIEVKKFAGFDSLESGETEEISLANAINRKNYYKEILLPIVKKLEEKTIKTHCELDISVSKAREISRNIIENRYQDKTNIPKDLSDLIEVEFKRLEPKIAGLNNSLERVRSWRDAIEDYIANIDVELSGATERFTVVIEY